MDIDEDNYEPKTIEIDLEHIDDDVYMGEIVATAEISIEDPVYTKYEKRIMNCLLNQIRRQIGMDEIDEEEC